MPKLKRPRTDNERLMAMTTAKRAVASLPPGPLSAETIARLDILLPQMEMEMQQRGNALAVQAGGTSAVRPARTRMRRLVLHFLRVFNMGVKRGVFSAADRGHYGLTIDSPKAPLLHTDADIALWAAQIVSGEAIRVAAGGTPMAMPSADEVAVQMEEFRQLRMQLSARKDSYAKEQADVDRLRKDVDALLTDIWDEVLFYFRKRTPSAKRKKARQYGVRYVPSSKTEVPDEELTD